MRFEGVRALVTGGASGIGRQTATRLIDSGARVGALDVTVTGVPEGALALQADLRDQSSVDIAIARAIGELGGLDVVVNNAGIGAVGRVEDNDDDEWHRLYDVNVLGIVRTSRAALPALRESPDAAIVNVSSVAATSGLPMRACYSATKGAVLSLTLAMAADLLPDGVRVNCVCPGTVDTPWVQRLLARAGDPVAERAALEARQPMGRLATPEEVADAILFLASPSSSFVTGVALHVDGGMQSLRRPVQHAVRLPDE